MQAAIAEAKKTDADKVVIPKFNKKTNSSEWVVLLIRNGKKQQCCRIALKRMLK